MIEEVIGQARRRFMLNEGLKKIAVSSIVVAAGVALILVVGTRWLEWWTLAPLAVTAGIYGALGMRRSVPTRYQAAVRLDRAAQLEDSLSTALHFAGNSDSFAKAQRSYAEEAARAVDVRAAVPLRIPRSLYGLAALVLAAASLVALRYGLMHTLDLRAPLTEVFFEDQAAHPSARKAVDAREALRRKNLESAESLLAKMGIPVSPDDARNQEGLDRAIEQALSPPANAAGEKGQKGDPGAKGENGRGANGAEQQAPGDPMDEKTATNSPREDNKAGGDKGTPKGGSGDSSSLLSKLKDAVSNMLSKATQGKDAAGQKSAAQQDQSAKSNKGKADKAGGKAQDGESSAEAQDGQPEGDGKDGQDAQSKSASKGAQQAGQSGSGVGNQDGSKDLRAAEQLRAMGKLSEIIGKRAATVSGETMIEVQSGNQKLSTAYSKKAAAHGEAGSDVSRDAIPVDLQPYVRQYFEQVRKSGVAEKSPQH